VKAACPTCGAEVEFRYDDSFVRVCGHCRSAVVRGDRGLDTLGRVADLLPIESALALFQEGRWRGLGFLVIGRAQLRHAAGGVWQEWYAKFDDGRWGWIAEAQGRLHLTFEAAGAGELPPWEAFAVAERITLEYDGPRSFAIAERGQAEYLAAEGEIPYRFVPGGRFRFADLSDGSGRFATLDYGAPDEPGPPAVYLGATVGLGELGLVAGGERPPDMARPIQARRLACPSCGGAVDLRVPDASLRVGCTYCGALLDATAGDLRVLALQGGDRPASGIPLGARGLFEGGEMTVVGYVRRVAILDGTRWPFDEYLLHHPTVGFRWLVDSDGHWSFVRPLDPGAPTDRGRQAEYGGVVFRKFQSCPLEVVAVLGELYWRVEVGERVDADDWIAPPAMLSRERGSGEIQWSLGEYLPRAEVLRRLGLDGVRSTPQGVAPNEPFRHAGAAGAFFKLLLAALAAAVVVLVLADNRVVASQRFAIEVPAAAAAEASPGAQGQVVFTEPFPLAGRKNVEIRLTADVDNQWVYAVGDLVNDDTGAVETFESSIELYRGYEGGEAWSEGDRSAAVHLGAVPAGRYVIRLEVARDTSRATAPIDLAVEVRQGVFRWAHLLALLIAIGLPGLGLALWQLSFERRRWRDSDFAPVQYRRSEDDDD